MKTWFSVLLAKNGKAAHPEISPASRLACDLRGARLVDASEALQKVLMFTDVRRQSERREPGDLWIGQLQYSLTSASGC